MSNADAITLPDDLTSCHALLEQLAGTINELNREKQEAKTPDALKHCPQHGPRKLIGYDTTETLEFERPQLRVRVTKYAKYICEASPEWLASPSAAQVLPKSRFGQALGYLRNHWEPLQLYLTDGLMPIDNNDVEQLMKKVILHRKNAMFYKTENGAHVGDVFMSLIYTCELCGANPFDYLTELQRHASALAARPQDWMPWNYQATLLACPHSNGDETCRNAG